MAKINYNIGLDLGTNSIGWAVTSDDFRVIKKGDKRLWGVALFDEGKSSAEYRTFRSSRRRFERRRVRIDLLQTLMSKSVASVDPTFFRRLDMSYLCSNVIDDKSDRDYRYNLFNGKFNDSTYYKEFKTIYHLRKYLMESNKKEDIRLIYLALHHIVKYRGNFLHQEDQLSINSINIEETIVDFVENYLSDEIVDSKQFFEELTKKDATKKDRLNSISSLFSSKELGNLCGKLVVGYSIDNKNIKKAFNLENDIDSVKLQFGKEDLDINIASLSDQVDDNIIDLIINLKGIYEDIMLIKIVGEGNSTISESMIHRYEKHQKDLSLLKQLLLGNYEAYKDMFNCEKAINNYVNYVNKTNKKVKSSKRKCTREDFYKYVISVVSSFDDSDIKSYILKEIEMDEFMPLINDVINSNIPYQLNYNEAKAIIDNQSQYYPELKENYHKILSIIKFRRPYSVGVLNSNSKFSWITQTINEKVYPWNFDKLVDLDKANENFIKAMVTKDAYTDDFVLPLESITYQKYIVLNELNNIRYKGSCLNVDIKKKVFDCFLRKTSVSCDDIIKVYKNEYNIDCLKDDFSGFSDNETKRFISSMKTYIKLKQIFGKDFNEKDIKLYDKIVESITIFNDKNVLKGVLEKLFNSTAHDYLSKYIKQLSKLSFSKWGKYSYQLLEGTLSTENNPQSINDLLYNTNLNFMQIIYEPRFGLMDLLKKENGKEAPTYKNLIEPLYASAAVKKTVWNSYKIVDEIVKIMGCEPKNIFIETTREDSEKKKTLSRYDALKDLYNSIKDDVNKYNVEQLKNELNKFEKIDKDKLYLYFMQLGKCMYSLKPINIDRLDECEIDHIVPRCYIKDDSFDNRVLVYRDANQRKSDLALSDEVINNCKDFWLFLYGQRTGRNQFISKKKLDNLMRYNWDGNTISGFINRQLVETTQINKLLKDVLCSVYSESEDKIKFVNSGIVSLFRNVQASEDLEVYGNFLKLRGLNDLHHAKDAYLVSIFGTFTTEVFPTWGQDERALQAKKLLEDGFKKASTKELINDRYGVIIDKLKSKDYECLKTDGEYITGENAYNNIITMMDLNDISIVKLKEEYANSSFYNQTIYSPKSGINLVSRGTYKNASGESIEMDPKLYGGYSNVNNAYFISINYSKGKKRLSKLVGVPVAVATQAKNISSDKPIVDYLIGEGFDAPEIVGKPVRKNQLINYYGQDVYITSDNEVVNATQLFVSKKYMFMLKCILDGKIEKAINIPEFKDVAKAFVLEYVEKINNYYPLYKSIGEKILEFANNVLLSMDDKDICKYISNLLIITKSGAGRIDMPKEWNGGSSWGRLSGKTISKNDDNIKWKDCSITGYYRNK